MTETYTKKKKTTSKRVTRDGRGGDGTWSLMTEDDDEGAERPVTYVIVLFSFLSQVEMYEGVGRSSLGRVIDVEERQRSSEDTPRSRVTTWSDDPRPLSWKRGERKS